MGDPCRELEATEDALMADWGTTAGVCEWKLVCTCVGRVRRNWADSVDMLVSRVSGDWICMGSELLDMVVHVWKTHYKSEPGAFEGTVDIYNIWVAPLCMLERPGAGVEQ